MYSFSFERKVSWPISTFSKFLVHFYLIFNWRQVIQTVTNIRFFKLDSDYSSACGIIESSPTVPADFGRKLFLCSIQFFIFSVLFSGFLKSIKFTQRSFFSNYFHFRTLFPYSSTPCGGFWPSRPIWPSATLAKSCNVPTILTGHTPRWAVKMHAHTGNRFMNWSTRRLIVILSMMFLSSTLTDYR